MELERIAARIAAVTPGEPEEEKEGVPEERLPEKDKVNWGKLKSTFKEQEMKAIVRDLTDAIKNQDIVQVQRLFGRLVKKLSGIAKATRQVDVKSKLDQIKKTFQD